MSEKLPHLKNHEIHRYSSEYSHENSGDHHNKIHQASVEHSSKKIENLRQTIEQQAKTNAEHSKAHHEKPNDHDHYHRHYVTKKIKQETYQKTLTQARQNLSTPNRAFSKLIHQPIVESLSEMGAKTVARPGSILSGGMVGFFGSLGLVFYAKTIGFPIPPSAFIIMFIAGYTLGLIIELVWSAILRKKYGKHRHKLHY